MQPDHIAQRSAPLDGLRGVAVLAVLMFHTSILPGGSVGVDVFFVLSGYLITSILAREQAVAGRVDVVAFLIRRARRLAPALFALLAAWAIFLALSGRLGRDHNLATLAVAGLYLMNVAEALATGWGGGLSHTWSLGVEEQFYLAWPFVLAALLKASRRRAALILFAAWIALSATRLGWMVLHIPPAGAAYYMLHSTGLLLGSAAALAAPARRWGVAGIAGIAGIFLCDSRTGVAWIVTATEIAAAAVIVDPPRWLGIAPLRALGRVSYGVYLWHIPILWILGGPSGPGRAASVAVAAIACAALSWRYIEQPLLTPSKTRRQASREPAPQAGLSKISAETIP